MASILRQVKQLPTKFNRTPQGLKKMENAFSMLDNILIPSIDFDRIASILELLKLSVIGQGQELLNTEEELKKLAAVQYAARRKYNTLSLLLIEAESTLQCFSAVKIPFEQQKM
uniref:Uncharacterized protein n=1 Tax=Caenorhabditis japonica TaxID=281687 RepID=A0A8R1IIP4_CAEJA